MPTETRPDGGKGACVRAPALAEPFTADRADLTLHLPPGTQAITWRALLDVPGIVPCLPGIELMDVLADRTYAGKVELRLGPLHVAYQGRVQIVEANEESHMVRMTAQAVDGRQAGATIRGQLLADEAGTTVLMETEIVERGLLARIGPGMIQMAAQRMAERFAGCLERRLDAARA